MRVRLALETFASELKRGATSVKAEYSEALGTTTIDAGDRDRQSFANSSSDASLVAREDWEDREHQKDQKDQEDQEDQASAAEATVSAEKLAAAQGRYVTKPQVGRAKSILYGTCLLAALSIGSFCAYQYLNGKSAQSQALASRVAPPAVTVSTAAAKIQNVSDTLSVTGSVSAWDPLSV